MGKRSAGLLRAVAAGAEGDMQVSIARCHENGAVGLNLATRHLERWLDVSKGTIRKHLAVHGRFSGQEDGMLQAARCGGHRHRGASRTFMKYTAQTSPCSSPSENGSCAPMDDLELAMSVCRFFERVAPRRCRIRRWFRQAADNVNDIIPLINRALPKAEDKPARWNQERAGLLARNCCAATMMRRGECAACSAGFRYDARLLEQKRLSEQ